MTSKVAKKIALSILCDFRGYTCHQGSAINVVFTWWFMKCSWRADLNGGPFAEDGPELEYFVPIIPNQYRVKYIYVRSFSFDITHSPDCKFPSQARILNRIQFL